MCPTPHQILISFFPEQRGLHTISLLYVTNDGRVNVNTVSCPAHQYFKSAVASPLSDSYLKKKSKCEGTTTLAPVTKSTLKPGPGPEGWFSQSSAHAIVLYSIGYSVTTN